MGRSVLITGASIAGNTVAYWLARQGDRITVVEKAPAFRGGGQNVDVRGTGRDVLRKMGLEEAALARNTGERGTDWVDAHDRVLARFAVDDLGDGPTAEMEILRGDLARLIYEPTRAAVTHRFGDHVAGLTQDASGVDVTFESGTRERYDLVIVAEGVGSPTRELVLPGEARSRWMDITLAFFSIPGRPDDGPYARQYNTVGGRGATLKPGPDGRLHVYVGMQKKPEGEHELDEAGQKAYVRARFAGAGWHFPRILAGMEVTDDFYFDVLRQVRMSRWSRGRVVLVGDAAWCPTPLSGVGTTLAVVGGYVLANELMNTPDHVAAFAAYERVMRPFVERGQGVPKIVPRLLWPHSRGGLACMRGAMRIASTPVVRKTFTRLFVRNARRLALPAYPSRGRLDPAPHRATSAR